jgi:hypothetical protein
MGADWHWGVQISWGEVPLRVFYVISKGFFVYIKVRKELA